jgi:hypothetical protein
MLASNGLLEYVDDGIWRADLDCLLSRGPCILVVCCMNSFVSHVH